MTGSELYDSIGEITGQLSLEEVTAALRRGCLRDGWDLENTETQITEAQVGGSKEIF